MTEGREAAHSAADLDYVPHCRYTVIFRMDDGSERSVRVITNRGEPKAVYLASWGWRTSSAVDVIVRNDGPPEVDESGVVILKGYGFDRIEW